MQIWTPLTQKIGAEVTQGDVVAKVGNTGMSTGPHLHFEVLHDGKSVDAAAKLNIYE